MSYTRRESALERYAKRLSDLGLGTPTEITRKICDGFGYCESKNHEGERWLSVDLMAVEKTTECAKCMSARKLAEKRRATSRP